jgi:hypothetical protein
LDDVIRLQQERLRDGQPERLRGPRIDDQLKLRGLFDREVGGLRALEDSYDVGRGTAIHLAQIRPIRENAAGFGKLAIVGSSMTKSAPERSRTALAMTLSISLTSRTPALSSRIPS